MNVKIHRSHDREIVAGFPDYSLVKVQLTKSPDSKEPGLFRRAAENQKRERLDWERASILRSV
jgi:hypothetical protein